MAKYLVSIIMKYAFIIFQFVGQSCGHHASYTFYKAIKYTNKKTGKPKILSLGEFFFVKVWSDSDLVSIGELQLLWEDKTTNQILSSMRLYYLPEYTPEGRLQEHGEVGPRNPCSSIELILHRTREMRMYEQCVSPRPSFGRALIVPTFLCPLIIQPTLAANGALNLYYVCPFLLRFDTVVAVARKRAKVAQICRRRRRRRACRSGGRATEESD